MKGEGRSDDDRGADVAHRGEGPRADVAQRDGNPRVVPAPREYQYGKHTERRPWGRGSGPARRLGGSHHACANASGRLISISTKAIGCGEPFITSCSTPGGRR